MSTAFQSKPRKAVEKARTFFNVVELFMISRKNVITTQQKNISDFEMQTSQELSTTQYDLAHCIRVNGQLDLCATVQLAAPEALMVNESSANR